MIDLQELATAIGQLTLRFRVRRWTAAEWTSRNEVLLSAELGLETDTGRVKIGDGVTAWNDLAYSSGGGGGEWLTGAGVPSSSLGADGDMYLNATTGDVYQKVAGAWGSPVANIKGPAGQGVPAGGTTGQVLAKTSSADFATAWVTPSGDGGGGGGVSGYLAAPQDSTFVAPINLTTQGNLDWVGVSYNATDSIPIRKRFGNRIGQGGGRFSGIFWFDGSNGNDAGISGWGWSGGLPVYNAGDCVNNISAGNISRGVYNNCSPGEGVGLTVEAATTLRTLRIYYSNGLPFRISASLSDNSVPDVSTVFNSQENGVATIVFRGSFNGARLNVSIMPEGVTTNLAISCITLGTS
jgi:hypothetical protein